VNNEYTVLLKTLYSGLSNGSERNKMMGGNYSKGSWPDRIAYQHVSEVVECGVSVSRFAVGDVVFTGTYPGHVPLHLAREDDLMVKLPASMDLPAAALMGVASVSMRDARLVLVAGRERVGFNFNAASGRRLATYSTAHFEQSDLEQVLRLAQNVLALNRKMGYREVRRGPIWDEVVRVSLVKQVDDVAQRVTTAEK
jgi:hypothetical protein